MKFRHLGITQKKTYNITVICHNPVEYITSQLLFIFCIHLPILNGNFLKNCMTSHQQKHVLDIYSYYVVSTDPILSLLEVNPLAPKDTNIVTWCKVQSY